MALRDPDKTRTKIISVAAELFHSKGYKGTGLSDILAKAEISKGALYHHFNNKQELLYAVFDHVYADAFLHRWQGIAQSEHPIDAIINAVKSLSQQSSGFDMCNGCPVHNIAAELAGQDELIRARIDHLFNEIQECIVQAFEHAKELGQVANETDSHKVALFFTCSLNGLPQMIKSCQDKEVFTKLTDALADYIASFKILQSN